jgi:feruloyl-CoA synthase
MQQNESLSEKIHEILHELAKKSNGSSTLIKKALIAPFVLSSENNEITEKGTINQNAVLTKRSAYIQMLYAETVDPNIFEIKI